MTQYLLNDIEKKWMKLYYSVKFGGMGLKNNKAVV